jgi:hypothetical protein
MSKGKAHDDLAALQPHHRNRIGFKRLFVSAIAEFLSARNATKNDFYLGHRQ